jgi:magnesium transporter
MLTIYDRSGRGLTRCPAEDPAAQGAIWLDLLNPTREEDQFVERMTGATVPTREEMQEIEVSSRLYVEAAAHFMTANVIYNTETADPKTTAITFVLTDKKLITVRYAEPKAFPLYLARAEKGDAPCDTPLAVMLGLLEAVIDRAADFLERVQLEVDRLALQIFDMKGGAATRSRRFDVVLKQVGREGELTARARESLLSIERLLTYLGNVAADRNEDKHTRARIKTEVRDAQSLADHVSYLTNRITFLLDATLGMINIEQNQIIKLFSVVAVLLMPPTLIASIYGMNFKHMPELDWPWAYPAALGLMLLSATGSYIYFRRKGWL